MTMKTRALLLSLLLTGSAAASGESAPAVVQCIKGGADGVPEITHLQAPWSVGDFLHVPANLSDVLTFRIGEDGRLAWSHRETLKVEGDQRITHLAAVRGDRVIAVERVGRGYNGKHFVSASLVVCGFDAKTGRRKELGRVPCPEASSLAVAPDGKTAYVMPRTGGKLLRFGIDGEGAVKPAGEDAGEKFAGRNLAASPDGKYLYWLRCTADKPTKPDQEMLFIEIAALGADGQVTHQETVEYKPPPGPIKFKNLYLAPDGGHAYLYVWDYKKGCDFGMIYARDAATGKLRLLDYQNEFKGKMYHLDFATPELGTCRNWRFGEKSAVTLFRRDSKTGQMADCGNLEGVTRIGWIAWAGSQYIAEKSALYVTGNDMNKGLRGIYVVRLEPAHWAPAAGK